MVSFEKSMKSEKLKVCFKKQETTGDSVQMDLENLVAVHRNISEAVVTLKLLKHKKLM